MSRPSFLQSLARRVGGEPAPQSHSTESPAPESDGDVERLRSELAALGEDHARLQQVATTQQRRAEAGEAALIAVRDRLDALEMELYVARSDKQRAVDLADGLRARLNHPNGDR